MKREWNKRSSTQEFKWDPGNGKIIQLEVKILPKFPPKSVFHALFPDYKFDSPTKNKIVEPLLMGLGFCRKNFYGYWRGESFINISVQDIWYFEITALFSDFCNFFLWFSERYCTEFSVSGFHLGFLTFLHGYNNKFFRRPSRKSNLIGKIDSLIFILSLMLDVLITVLRKPSTQSSIILPAKTFVPSAFIPYLAATIWRHWKRRCSKDLQNSVNELI